ncbi:MAG TPA: pyruvate formate lyase family protein, partial [Phycisphaerae bacterium]|nr:pyruvate formate lyase family protein [Phycisphaerae bacterium]
MTRQLGERFEKAWAGFNAGQWQNAVDVRGFIQLNYTPYDGGPEFLASPTPRTQKIMAKYEDLLKQEAARGGVLDVDASTVSSLLTYNAGYLDKDNEIIVGLQTDAPLKRGLNPFGGMRMAKQACEAYGYHVGEDVQKSFEFRTTHNDGVFHVYTDEIRAARKSGIITGLPDAYGRGRIIGDYRRVALYGLDFLIEQKRLDKKNIGLQDMSEDNIRLSEEL